jgi:hypothetical protein
MARTPSESRWGSGIMAKKMKKKKTTKAKMRDMKPRKQVKGGMAVKSDPCEGGELSRR